MNEKLFKLITALVIFFSVLGFILLAASSKDTIKDSETKKENNSLIINNNSLDLKIADKNDPQKITLKKGTSTLSFKIPEKNINWKKENDKINADTKDKTYSYSFIKNNNQTTGVKEEIILKTKKAVDEFISNPDEYKFPIELKNLEARKKDNLWHFYNLEGKDLFYIPKPFMFDAENNRSENIKIDIKNNLLTLNIDKNWLLSKTRVYPITMTQLSS